MRSSMGCSMWQIALRLYITFSSGTEGRRYLRRGQGMKIYGVSRLPPPEEKAVSEGTLPGLRTVHVVKAMQVLGSPREGVAEAREDHGLSSFSLPEFAPFLESSRTQVAVKDQYMFGHEIQKPVVVLGLDDEREICAPKSGMEVQSRIHLASVCSQAEDQVRVRT